MAQSCTPPSHPDVDKELLRSPLCKIKSRCWQNFVQEAQTFGKINRDVDKILSKNFKPLERSRVLVRVPLASPQVTLHSVQIVHSPITQSAKQKKWPWGYISMRKINDSFFNIFERTCSHSLAYLVVPNTEDQFSQLGLGFILSQNVHIKRGRCI